MLAPTRNIAGQRLDALARQDFHHTHIHVQAPHEPVAQLHRGQRIAAIARDGAQGADVLDGHHKHLGDFLDNGARDEALGF